MLDQVVLPANASPAVLLSERHRIYDSILSEAQATIDELRTGASKELAETFSKHVSRLILPNLRNGITSLPKSSRETNQIPILVGQDSADIRLDGSFYDFTPHQIERLDEQLPTEDSPSLIRFLEQAMRGASRRLTPLEPHVHAVVKSLAARSIDGRFELVGRPFIQVGPQFGTSALASVLYHEMVHVDQVEDEPIQQTLVNESDHRISRELEAYDRQHQFNQAILASESNRYDAEALRHDTVASIAELCDLNPEADRYRASQAVKQAIQQHDFQL